MSGEALYDLVKSIKNIHYKRVSSSGSTGGSNNVLVPIYSGSTPGRISSISGTGANGTACSGRVVVMADGVTYYSETVSLGSGNNSATLTLLNQLPFRNVEIFVEKTGGSNWITFNVSYELQTEG
ncbi:MAG: hypothetical protein EOM00_14915 [Clostridia bacterium]|nr:hypothetical protein [Clostridia bacterium]